MNLEHLLNHPGRVVYWTNELAYDMREISNERYSTVFVGTSWTNVIRTLRAAHGHEIAFTNANLGPGKKGKKEKIPFAAGKSYVTLTFANGTVAIIWRHQEPAGELTWTHDSRILPAKDFKAQRNAFRISWDVELLPQLALDGTPEGYASLAQPPAAEPEVPVAFNVVDRAGRTLFDVPVPEEIRGEFQYLPIENLIPVTDRNGKLLRFIQLD